METPAEEPPRELLQYEEAKIRKAIRDLTVLLNNTNETSIVMAAPILAPCVSEVLGQLSRPGAPELDGRVLGGILTQGRWALLVHEISVPEGHNGRAPGAEMCRSLRSSLGMFAGLVADYIHAETRPVIQDEHSRRVRQRRLQQPTEEEINEFVLDRDQHARVENGTGMTANDLQNMPLVAAAAQRRAETNSAGPVTAPGASGNSPPDPASRSPPAYSPTLHLVRLFLAPCPLPLGP